MGFSPRDTDPFKRRKPRRTPFERRIIRSSLWLAIPGLLTSGVLIWLQDWAIESKLALLFAELVVCALVLAALHDQIIRPPADSGQCGRRSAGRGLFFPRAHGGS
jgi:hypothetical protein